MSTADVSLDFNMLDDLALGVERDLIDPNILPLLKADTLGPFIETMSLASAWHQPELAELAWLNTGIFDPILNDLKSRRTQVQQTGTLTGWIGADQIDDETHWTGFLIRVSSAINSGGFDKQTKQAIMATFGEFRSNVIEHANLIDGAIAAFHADASGLEITVADRGRGILDSIKEIRTFEDLTDAGRALKLTVTDGVSRYDDPQRGHGFTYLFKGLANRFTHVRLRSGDHALEVFNDHRSAPTEHISQKAPIPGFFVYARFDHPN